MSHPDIVELECEGRRVVLVGTAHISRESAALVRRVVQEVRPDAVCVELDAQRLQALRDPQRWRHLDLERLMRERQLATFVLHLVLAGYQRRLASQLGARPGLEMLEAVEAAQAAGAAIVLCDRPVRATLLRTWRSLSFWRKLKLLAAVLEAPFARVELTEAELARLRRQDVLSEALGELARAFPEVKRVLLDERDAFIAETIRRTSGARLVAVVGAGHLQGVRRHLEAARPVDLDALGEIPPPGRLGRAIGWGVPAAILGALGWVAMTRGAGAAGEHLGFWILANGIPSALGAAIALAHPWTILAAFLAAPWTSLTPVIGAGYVTAFVQAWLRPPRVADFETLAEDASRFGRWWRNRVLKVLLAFLLPGLGSVIGTYVGGARILAALFER